MHFYQFLFTNLLKSVLVSTDKMLIKQYDFCTGVPWTGNNNRSLVNVQFYLEKDFY